MMSLTAVDFKRVASLLSKGVEICTAAFRPAVRPCPSSMVTVKTISSGFICNQESRIIGFGYFFIGSYYHTNRFIPVPDFICIQHMARVWRMGVLVPPKESFPSSVDSIWTVTLTWESNHPFLKVEESGESCNLIIDESSRLYFSKNVTNSTRVRTDSTAFSSPSTYLITSYLQSKTTWTGLVQKPILGLRQKLEGISFFSALKSLPLGRCIFPFISFLRRRAVQFL